MLLIPCPYCGPRPELEFRYAGEAHIARAQSFKTRDQILLLELADVAAVSPNGRAEIGRIEIEEVPRPGIGRRRDPIAVTDFGPPVHELRCGGDG